MKVTGIIVEYNPFHNGHSYHLNETIKHTNSDIIIAVMSGNYTERGEPAIIDKKLRTELALKAGVDIVIELPYLFAVGHADLFSFGAISLLNYCKVNEIVFGSESNDPDNLNNLAETLFKPDFDVLLKAFLAHGYSYPKAANLALEKLLNKKYHLNANDLLGIQYIHQIKKINPNITYRTIKRIHNEYNTELISHNSIASATSIRNALKMGDNISSLVPKASLKMLETEKLHFWDEYFPFLKYQIISNQNSLKNIHDVNEGIENRIIAKIKTARTFDALVAQLVSKRYTKGKIKRILTHILNHVTKTEVKHYNINQGPNYLRILGFNESKSGFLKDLKQDFQIPIITNINKTNYHLLKLDLRVNEVYHCIDDSTEQKIPVMIKR
jgi:predicted nucleotidyltransferase